MIFNLFAERNQDGVDLPYGILIIYSQCVDFLTTQVLELAISTGRVSFFETYTVYVTKEELTAE